MVVTFVRMGPRKHSCSISNTLNCHASNSLCLSAHFRGLDEEGKQSKMHRILTKSFAFIAATEAVGFQSSTARGGLKIKFPKCSERTSVQRRNRERVEAIRNRQCTKAGDLFYKAYLYDQVNPFTLNNLRYLSQFQSKLDRAPRFYNLAFEHGSNADIDTSSAKDLKVKPKRAALEGLEDLPMRDVRPAEFHSVPYRFPQKDCCYL